KQVPLRTTTMLIARDSEGRVLLERRPPSGVWACLWSLPEAADVEQARLGIPALRDSEAVPTRVLPDLLHRFSHYQLRISPVVFNVASAAAQVADDPDHGWFLLEDLDELGLPAPVRKLLADLQEESNPCEPSTA